MVLKYQSIIVDVTTVSRLHRFLQSRNYFDNHYKYEYDVFLLVTQAYSDKVKKNPSAPNRSRTYDLPISTSDALPLSYRRLVVERPLN